MIRTGIRNIEQASQSFRQVDQEIRDLARWRVVPTTTYTATPSSTSTIAMSSTSLFEIGLPIKYRYDGDVYYGAVRTFTEDASLTIAGPALDTGKDIEMLWVGRPEAIVQRSWFIPGDYGSSVADNDKYLLHTYVCLSDRWGGPTAYLVDWQFRHKVDATTTQPAINMVIYNPTWIAVGNAGVSVTTAQAGASPPVGTINASNYQIARGMMIDVLLTTAGAGATPASDLGVVASFVLE